MSDEILKSWTTVLFPDSIEISSAQGQIEYNPPYVKKLMNINDIKYIRPEWKQDYINYYKTEVIDAYTEPVDMGDGSTVYPGSYFFSYHLEFSRNVIEMPDDDRYSCAPAILAKGITGDKIKITLRKSATVYLEFLKSETLKLGNGEEIFKNITLTGNGTYILVWQRRYDFNRVMEQNAIIFKDTITFSVPVFLGRERIDEPEFADTLFGGSYEPIVEVFEIGITVPPKPTKKTIYIKRQGELKEVKQVFVMKEGNLTKINQGFVMKSEQLVRIF